MIGKRELNEVRGELRIGSLDLKRELSELRIRVAVLEGTSEKDALNAEIKRGMGEVRAAIDSYKAHA